MVGYEVAGVGVDLAAGLSVDAADDVARNTGGAGRMMAL